MYPAQGHCSRTRINTGFRGIFEHHWQGRMFSLERNELYAFTLETTKFAVLGLLLHERQRTTAQKSTKQSDRKKAWEVCLTLERAEGMAAKGTLTEARARELIGEVLER